MQSDNCCSGTPALTLKRTGSMWTASSGGFFLISGYTSLKMEHALEKFKIYMCFAKSLSHCYYYGTELLARPFIPFGC